MKNLKYVCKICDPSGCHLVVPKGSNEPDICPYQSNFKALWVWVKDEKPLDKVDADRCDTCGAENAIMNSSIGRVCYYCGCPETAHD